MFAHQLCGKHCEYYMANTILTAFNCGKHCEYYFMANTILTALW